MIFLIVLLLLMSALLILAWSLMLTSLLLMLTRCLIQCFIHFVGSLVYMPVTPPEEETDCSAPVRVHLFPQHRRSTFVLYPLLYAMRHCRRGQDGGKITSADASRMMFLEPSSSQVA